MEEGEECGRLLADALHPDAAFVYMAIGYGLRKGKILKAEARDAFTEFVILVTLPCMIFESFQITLTVETLQKGLLSLFVASSVEVLSLIISNVAFRFCKKMRFLSCATGRWSVTPVLPVCRLLKMGMGWTVFFMPASISSLQGSSCGVRASAFYDGTALGAYKEGPIQPGHHCRRTGAPADAL